jgi:hypothetical protein
VKLAQAGIGTQSLVFRLMLLKGWSFIALPGRQMGVSPNLAFTLIGKEYGMSEPGMRKSQSFRNLL